MKTKMQKLLIKKRDQLKAKNDELLKRFEAIIDLAEKENRDFTEEEQKTSNFLSNYMKANWRVIREIDDKIATYEIIEDCIDEFYKRLKKEFDIKPKIDQHKKD